MGRLRASWLFAEGLEPLGLERAAASQVGGPDEQSPDDDEDHLPLAVRVECGPTLPQVAGAYQRLCSLGSGGGGPQRHGASVVRRWMLDGVPSLPADLVGPVRVASPNRNRPNG
jgi:hypothetical protein